VSYELEIGTPAAPTREQIAGWADGRARVISRLD
jgi:hypothetical protein